MTPHLSSDHLVDAAEGALAADRATHLEHCESCRARVAELRAALDDAALSAVPEPSPLFWDHLSRRVREATAGEATPRPLAWWHGLWQPLIALGAVAGAAALVVLLRGTGPAETHAPATTNVVAGSGVEPAASDDASVDVVSAVAGDLSFDELRSADLVPSRSVVDLAVSQLNEDQQRELMRLMREELGGLE
ncbi:MAG TPA: hypothetical protein VLT86_07995 [Vicinamibacterales bacterium]|nr:hypothetical protein [Vicinamibacterales bacterium]